MWFEIVVGALAVGSYIYHRWFQDQPPATRWQPITLPRSAEGVPLPLLYGTVRVRTPIMVWSGNQYTPGQQYDRFEEIPFSPNPVTADHYSVDMIFALGVPPYSPPDTGFAAGASLVQMWYGDTPVALSLIPVAAGIHRFYAGKFTSPTGGGGGDSITSLTEEFNIAGIFSHGDTATTFPLDSTNAAPYVQTFPDGSTNIIGGGYPDLVAYDYNGGTSGSSALTAITQSGDLASMGAMRNQVGAYMHICLGLASTISGFSFGVKAPTNFTRADLGVEAWRTSSPFLLGSDCDPAAVLYDIITSPWGKLGIDRARVDIESFQAASQTLFNEFNGYSRFIDQSTDASQIIGEILQQIDGILYEEPTTGKLTLKLVRFDYNAALLDDVNPTNAAPDGAGWYSVQSWAEVPNQVKITFTDRDRDYQDGVVVAQDPVVASASGGRLRTAALSFPGVCHPANAQFIASRELNAMCRPMVKASMTVSRAFYAHRPGDVVTLTWPDLGISKMVMRIAGIDFGQLHDPAITVQLMRDVFDIRVGSFPYPA